MSLQGNLGLKFSKLSGSKFTLVFLVLQPKSDTLEDYKRIVVLKGVRSREHINKFM